MKKIKQFVVAIIDVLVEARTNQARKYISRMY